MLLLILFIIVTFIIINIYNKNPKILIYFVNDKIIYNITNL